MRVKRIHVNDAGAWAQLEMFLFVDTCYCEVKYLKISADLQYRYIQLEAKIEFILNVEH